MGTTCQSLFGLEKLDRASALDLIDCIEVSERIADDGKKQQGISIKYEFIGDVDETPEKAHIGA